jgi:hypothetical protein
MLGISGVILGKKNSPRKENRISKRLIWEAVGK